jgi:hypothetical protein
MKLGVAVIVLLVGFDGDEEAGRLGGDTTIDGLPDMALIPEGKAELSAGERSRSSVGSDGLDVAVGSRVSAPTEAALECVRCDSASASAWGIGIVDRID